MLLSSLCFAETIPSACYVNAAGAVESLHGDTYDREGFEAYDCEISPVGKAIVCDVAASKGNGDAIDTYQVVLSKSCAKVFKVTLIGEE